MKNGELHTSRYFTALTSLDMMGTNSNLERYYKLMINIKLQRINLTSFSRWNASGTSLTSSFLSPGVLVA